MSLSVRGFIHNPNQSFLNLRVSFFLCNIAEHGRSMNHTLSRISLRVLLLCQSLSFSSIRSLLPLWVLKPYFLVLTRLPPLPLQICGQLASSFSWPFIQFLYTPYVSETIQHLSFSFWLTSLTHTSYHPPRGSAHSHLFLIFLHF